MPPFLTVVIPAYNEERNLATTVPLVAGELSALACDYEIIIVNDGSTDSTPQVASSLAGENQRVRVVHHAANLGIGQGIFTGIKEARGEFFIIIPADLALDIKELSRYLEAAREADVVVGLRSDRRDYTFFRRVVSWLNIQLIQKLFGMRERQFNYISLFRTRLLKDMDLVSQGSAFIFAEMIIRAKDAGARLTQGEVRYAPRARGQATGARLGLILRTGRDMLRFWWRRKLAKG
ncbi:MAG: glycosyltransferase family 2 protein [Chloroflexi bacterium]|nr:glycosyltransferase family 2 protein [Chloroflexota bacterium]